MFCGNETEKAFLGGSLYKGPPQDKGPPQAVYSGRVPLLGD